MLDNKYIMENLQDELNDYKNINHQAYKDNHGEHRQTGLDWFNSQMLRLVPQKYNPEPSGP